MDYKKRHTTDASQLIYTEYEDEYRSVAVIEDPSMTDAWLLSTHYVPLEQ